MGRATLVHLVPMPAGRRGTGKQQQQQQPPQHATGGGRTRGLGTLGACMISPSSAYVLLWAGAGEGQQTDTETRPPGV